MAWLILSVLLFGIIYPGSNYFLNNGLSTFAFTTGFLLIRSVTQILFAILKPEIFKLRINIFYFIIFGAIGASLNFFEFKGIKEGLDISINAFLVFCHPLWGLLIRSIFMNRKLTSEDLYKLCLGIIGVILIISPSLTNLFFDHRILYPILAGIAFSIWIIFSEKFSTSKNHALSFSLYYDISTLIILLLVGTYFNSSTDINSLQNIFNSKLNIILFIIYSISAGVLPNLFFYFGINRTDGIKGSFILLLEPVIATLISLILYQEIPATNTIFGAILIIIANIQPNFIKGLIKRFNIGKFFKKSWM